MKKQFLVLCSALLVLSACTKRHSFDRLHFYQDFESMKGWTQEPLLTDLIPAHSGIYSTYTDKNAPYSQTLQLSTAELGTTKVKKFKGTVWCNIASMDCAGGLCMQIANPAGENLLWISTNLKDVVKTVGTWTKVSVYADITPEMLDPKNTIKFFLWNTASEKIYLDDFELAFTQ